MLAGGLALKGRRVIAVDADPDANLASALGVPADQPIKPLAEMPELIEERTGSASGYGGYFKLNPKVDDIPEAYSRPIGNIRLLVLGGVSGGGKGCICPASALLKALLVHLILGRDDAIVMDMEAGIEHLGRATAQSMEALIVVVDSSPWSIQTAKRVCKLAGEIGMKNIFAVANRIRQDGELDEIRDRLGDVPLIGQVPMDERLKGGIIAATADGGLEGSEGFTHNLKAVEDILGELESRV